MPKVYQSPAMHRQNECCYPRPDGKQCYEALENNEYIDILEPVLNRCGIETKRGYRRIPMNNDDGDKIMRQNVAEKGTDLDLLFKNVPEKENNFIIVGFAYCQMQNIERCLNANAYTNGDYIKFFSISLGHNEFNHTSGISSLLFSTSRGAYQIQFEPPLIKNDTQIMNIKLPITSGR